MYFNSCLTAMLASLQAKTQKEESKHQPRDQNDKNKNETTGSDTYTLIACCKRTSIDGDIPLSPSPCPATDHPAEARGGIPLSPLPATATGGIPSLPLSCRSYWRYPLSPPIPPLLLAVPLSPSLLVSLSRHWHWRFKLPANGDTHVRNRPLRNLL